MASLGRTSMPDAWMYSVRMVEVAPYEVRRSFSGASQPARSGWWSITTSGLVTRSGGGSPNTLGWTSTSASPSSSSSSAGVMVRTSTPSAFTMAWFSGRVTAPNETSGAVGERRPSNARSASPEAMPSGSGSGWSRMPTFSREANSSWSCTTRCRFPRCANSRSTSSRICVRSPVRRRQG